MAGPAGKKMPKFQQKIGTPLVSKPKSKPAPKRYR